jgi:hypothetical protein
LHAVLFDPDNPSTLYVGSDGGMLAVHNLTPAAPSGVTFQSNFSRQLLDLEMYHAVASAQSNGLVATALQDNGTDEAQLTPFGSGSWAQQADSDGVNVEFVTPVGLPAGNDILIRAESCCNGAQWAAAAWNGSQFGSGKVIPVATSQNSRDPAGIGGGPVKRVQFPRFANGAGQRMYAVAALQQTVYGLFASDDGSDMHWETVCVVGTPDNVTAVSSFDGSTVFAGTDQLHIFQLDAPYTGTPTSLQIANPTTSPAAVTSIVEFTPSIGFATLNSGFVLGWLGQTWQQLGAGALPNDQPFGALALPDLGSLFVVSQTSVFVSHDSGATWATAISGLPKLPLGQDINFVAQPDGTHYLYLATYGRSLWRATLP